MRIAPPAVPQPDTGGMMTDNRHPQGLNAATQALLRAVSVLLLTAATVWLLLSDYQPMSLAGLIAFYFLAYVAMRLLWFLDNNRFTPKRQQVGLNWALTGFNARTAEFDVRPVRVYFLLLALMSVGLFLRPIVKWVIA
jgi:hypothetical protein